MNEPKRQRPISMLTVAALTVAAFGFALRLAKYLAQPSLWNDEQLLALNIGRRSPAGLLRVLDHDQAAPVLFLELEKLATLVGGMNELALRFIPLLAGLATLPLIFVLVRRLTNEAFAVLAVVIVAASPVLLAFANETKPYAGDAAIAALLMWLALRVIDRPDTTHWRPLTVAGVTSIWLSIPAHFIVAGIAAALVFVPSMRTERAVRRHYGVMALAWVGAGVVSYLLFLRPASANEYLRSSSLWFVPGDGLTGVTWLASLWSNQLLFPTFLRFEAGRGLAIACGAIIVSSGIVGAIDLARRRGLAVALLVVSPIILSMLVAIVHLYPAAPRLHLWLVPSFIALSLAGLFTVTRALSQRIQSAVPMVLAVAVALANWPTSFRELGDNRGDRSVTAAWKAERSDSTPVYVAARAAPSWAFYTTDWSRPDTNRLDWYAQNNASTGTAFRNRPSRGRPVKDEGRDITWQAGSRLELLGTPSGMQNLTGRIQPEHPDAGWAENEAANIRTIASPGVWVYFAFFHPQEKNLVLSAIESLGGERLKERVANSAALYRYRFPHHP